MAESSSKGEFATFAAPTPMVDFDDRRIKNDIIRIIAQYLEDEGHVSSRTVLLDEVNLELADLHKNQSNIKKLRVAIRDGSWEDAVNLCKQLLKAQNKERALPVAGSLKAFMFAIHKQHYLEQLERREFQQAFNYLTTRMKRFEGLIQAREMQELAYALTCQSVEDVESFQDWDITVARSALIEQLDDIVRLQIAPTNDETRVPHGRLKTLLQQAVSNQRSSIKEIERSRKLDTLLEDYKSIMVPSALASVLSGHQGNVKCVCFDKLNPTHLLSGSSDNTVRVWDIETGNTVISHRGHTSRIWDVDSHASGACISASADSTIKIWPNDGNKCTTVKAHASDVYSVRIHPNGKHFVSAGYDRSVRLFDMRTAVEVKTFRGHELGVSKAVFNNYGNLIISGSKDSTVKLWDIASGLCISTFSGQFTEITGIDINEVGDQILFATRSSTNVLLDLRMNRILKRFRGHQNSTHHFVDVRFGPTADLATGGSEDGSVYLWNINTGEINRTLEGHEGPVYSTAWSSNLGLLASCSEDRTIRLWS